MHGRFFSGMIDPATQQTLVMHYKADPTVKEISAVQGTFNWGPRTTTRERLQLAEHLLKGMDAPQHAVREFADEYVMQMAEGKMWMLSAADLYDWVVAKAA